MKYQSNLWKPFWELENIFELIQEVGKNRFIENASYILN